MGEDYKILRSFLYNFVHVYVILISYIQMFSPVAPLEWKIKD
jgi:hypothetical protein